MLAIICPPGWDRVNWSAKIKGYPLLIQALQRLGFDKFWRQSVCNDRKRKLCELKNSLNRFRGTYIWRIFTTWNQCVLQSEPSLQWLRGCLVLLESRIKRKREKAAIPQMRKFKLFFFVFQATLLQSQLTRSLRSSTSSFQCWLLAALHC